MNPTHVIGGYREFAPGAEATGFCESVWIHQTPDGLAPAGAAHRVLPELGVSLAFQGFRDADGRPRAWSPILAGPKLQAQVFDLVPGRELAAIKIKPEWVGPLLGIDPLAVERQAVDLLTVAPSLAYRLHDVLAQTRCAEAALRVLMAEMLAAQHVSRTPPSTVACVALAGTSPRALHEERRRQIIDDRAMSVLSNPG